MALMLCSWEGNRRSGLAMRHRLSGIPTYGLNGLGKGGKQCSTAPLLLRCRIYE